MIRVLPLDQLKELKQTEEYAFASLAADGKRDFRDVIGSEYELFMSGSDAIRALMESLQLGREDEVYITTTTDSTYVSTCVSGTVFNFSKISRVLTEKTKAIFVIHTYGFPHPELLQLRAKADELQIPLIEDCISSFDSYNAANIRLGSVGDYAVYSLSKIFPLAFGGVLSYKLSGIEGCFNNTLKNEFEKWVPVIPSLKERRRLIYSKLKELLPPPIYPDDVLVNPFMYGFTSPEDIDFRMEFMKDIEFGRTHVRREVHIPTNPFAGLDLYVKILSRWKKE